MSYRVETNDGAVIGTLIEKKIRTDGKWIPAGGWLFYPWVSNHKKGRICRPTALAALPRWVQKMEYTLIEY